MKKSIFFATVVAMAFAMVMPAKAQSLKEKKQAKKENWQREQRQKAEEDELRHQLHMDSIANAKKIADEKAAKAEAERRNREAEERARQKKAEEEAALQEVEHVEPCSDLETTVEMIRGRGVGTDRNQQFSVEKARAYAVNELASEISSKVESLMRIQNMSKDVDEMNNFAAMSKQEIEMAVKQTTGFSIACRKTMTFTQNGVRMMKTYMVVEISAERVLKAAYDALMQNNQTKIDETFDEFHKDFKEHFSEL